MATWHEYVQRYGTVPKWPYPIDYGKENEVNCDVLVLGGGIAGCWAAIGAARKGARVVLVEKETTKNSGAGGAGLDHWQNGIANPASKISPEEFTQALIDNQGGWRNGIQSYITSREGYDCLLELEKMGLRIRDYDDEFKGAEFRDEKTKLLFALDYTAKYSIRVPGGNNVKPTIYAECNRLGVKIYDHVFVSSLLNEGGKQGARVVGATGVNARTGEFYIFKGKASILCMFHCQRQHAFSTELKGLSPPLHRPASLTGDGNAMAWRAGAQLTAVEQSSNMPGIYGPFGYILLGEGAASTSWYAATLVDANGKEIPWVDRDGHVLKTVSERYRPAPGQKFFLSMTSGTGAGKGDYRYRGPRLLPIIGEPDGVVEAELPLYADLASMPEHEGRVIYELMLSQEGKTMVGAYLTFTRAGFDWRKDMYQTYDGTGMGGGDIGPPKWRLATGGGLVVDWDLKTSLDGLYAAGVQQFAPGDHAYAAATGRYAGRKVADYVVGVGEPVIDRKQVEMEKARVYAPVQRKNGMEWKELNAGVCKVMQDYCGAVKSEELLKIGLKWFDEIEAGEAASAFARNPHELVRVLEVFSIITNGQMIMEACRARKASNTELGFIRSDYPAIDPPEWRKWVTIKQDEGKVKVGELALDYYGDLKKNYEAHCGL